MSFSLQGELFLIRAVFVSVHTENQFRASGGICTRLEATSVQPGSAVEMTVSGLTGLLPGHSLTRFRRCRFFCGCG